MKKENNNWGVRWWYRNYGIWAAIDYMSHKPWVRLPAFLRKRICDRFDRSMGGDPYS